jgi:hypothetical protein
MRIISQDNRKDVPYEQYSFKFGWSDDYSQLYINAKNMSGQSERMATYSSEEKAIKAMEMLHKTYGNYLETKSNNYYFAFDYPKVFQFPQDDEIEV